MARSVYCYETKRTWVPCLTDYKALVGWLSGGVNVSFAKLYKIKTACAKGFLDPREWHPLQEQSSKSRNFNAARTRTYPGVEESVGRIIPGLSPAAALHLESLHWYRSIWNPLQNRDVQHCNYKVDEKFLWNTLVIVTILKMILVPQT